MSCELIGQGLKRGAGPKKGEPVQRSNLTEVHSCQRTDVIVYSSGEDALSGRVNESPVLHHRWWEQRPMRFFFFLAAHKVEHAFVYKKKKT